MKEDIEERLERIRATVQHARSMPMSASAVVNRSELLELLDNLEEAIDGTLTRATEVVEDRDAVVAEGQSEAEEIVRRAEAHREKLVSDTDVYRLAQDRADEVLAKAQREAEELRRETDAYVEESLANFELTLERTLEMVRRGRARLMGGHVHGLGDDSDVADIALPEHMRREGSP
jgi:cell division septum initiation protein DivIVA